MFVDTHTYSKVPDSCLEDDSFTLSYSLKQESWTCFHDYVPDFAFSLRDQKYLQFSDNRLYRMNVGNPGTYFGAAFPSYITPVFAPPLQEAKYLRKYPFRIKSISWNTDVEDQAVRLLEETWSTISLHNSFQGTREIVLVPFIDTCTFKEQYKAGANVRRIKNNWLYNYAINEKVLTSERTWKEVQDNFYTQNTENKDCTRKSLFRTPMVDDYVIVKLTYNNYQPHKLFFYELTFDISPVKQ